LNPERSAPLDAAVSSRRTIPVVTHFAVEIDDGERRDLARLARRLLADEPALSGTPFGPGVRAGLGDGPGLVIEDHSWISLFEHVGDVAYTYRALLLAGDGDQVAIGVERNPAFERYCREVLGLGDVEMLTPEVGASTDPIALRCAGDDAIVDKVAARARAAGVLDLLPYMGTGGVWRLAGAIAARAGVQVRVAAPPPRLVRRVNDKLWFADRVAEVLGREALPPAYAAYGPGALVRQLLYLAGRHASVAVKIPDSASSSGNVVLEASDLRDLEAAALEEHVLGVLRRAGWRGGYPLMVTGWERPVLASPSVQLWVPAPEDGGPVVEGVFDQVLVGTAAVFSGAAPSTLPPEIQTRLVTEAARLACFLQELGYFGRCSFDAIVVDDQPGTARLHWVECNGRWGGVSIPMTLLNRLVGDWQRVALVIAERDDLQVVRQNFEAVLAALEPELYAAGGPTAGAIVLSPGRITEGTGFEFMVLDETPAAARARADSLATKLVRLMEGQV
jgi:hypothetical protein